MATTYKRSGIQGTAAVGTYTTLYTVPSSTVAVISTVAICNTASTAATYRVGFSASAGTPTAADWLVYDANIAANDMVALGLGISIGTGQSIRVSSSSDTVTFQAFISEIS